jgi:hypothetical protein
MKKEHMIILVLATISVPSLSVVSAFGQVDQQSNLVPNESFEELVYPNEWWGCPTSSNGIELCKDWSASGGSVDYFHACAVGSDYPDYGVPTNVFGYQEAMHGDAYALFAVFAEGIENSREYIEVELKEPLVSGKVYELSFYVNLPDERKYAVSEIGALFTTGSTSDYSGTEYFNAQPQVVNPKERILNDKEDWMEITDTFTVQGGEKFLTIGCFEPYSNLTIEVTYDSVGLYNPGCAYFLDMVTLKQVGTVGVKDMEQTSFNLYPNPVNKDGWFTVDHDLTSGSVEFVMFNLMGIEVKRMSLPFRSTQIDLGKHGLSCGAYSYQLMVEGNSVGSGKIFIQ